MLRSSVFALATLVSLSGYAHAASRLTNVSVRSAAGTEADTLMVGFGISGTGAKQLLLRGIGPSLRAFNVEGAVSDSELRLYDQAPALITSNDDWAGANAIVTTGDAVGAFQLARDSKDSALLLQLGSGSYSAHLITKSGPGIALVEAYDADTGAPTTQISNLSTRSLAGTGAEVLTIGFNISGDSAKTVLIRAIGPTLGGFNVPGALANPQLRLFSSSNQEIGYNNDWLTAANWSQAFSAVGAFLLDNGTRDAALLVRLPPGTYTAQASGVSNTRGIALIEVYDAPETLSSSFVYQPLERVAPADYPNTPSIAVSPTVLTQARPAYPFELRRAGAEGNVLIQFIVETDGRVSNAIALRAHDQRLAEAGLAAVRQWTFRPARNAAGVNVPTTMQVPIIFTLNG